jgi:hypothetical protein
MVSGGARKERCGFVCFVVGMTGGHVASAVTAAVFGTLLVYAVVISS